MPCNIGYKVVAKIVIPVPQVQEIKEEVTAPEIDQDLLEKIGEEDLEFLDWLKEFDSNPLLKKALELAREKIEGSKSLKTSIKENGRLSITGKYVTAKEKSEVEAIISSLSSQFQMEVLAIVAQLLDYRISMNQETVGGEVSTVIEGEKDVDSGVNRYLKISKNKAGEGVFSFEHFESKKSLVTEQQNFLALAQKLGIKISISEAEQKGQPIAQGTLHKHFVKA